MAYDWTGQRTRRIKMMRMATSVMFVLLLAAIFAVLLQHYNLIR